VHLLPYCTYNPAYVLQLEYYPLPLECNVNRKDEHEPNITFQQGNWSFYVKKFVTSLKCEFVTFLVAATLHLFTTSLINLFQNGVNLCINVGYIKLFLL
jgi:hypothetical protein